MRKAIPHTIILNKCNAAGFPSPKMSFILGAHAVGRVTLIDYTGFHRFFRRQSQEAWIFLKSCKCDRFTIVNYCMISFSRATSIR
jgi:hypothetical protein